MFGFKSFIIILGRGVVSLWKRQKGEFLLQYKGELVDGKEGEKREEKPSGYRYFFHSSSTGKLLW